MPPMQNKPSPALRHTTTDTETYAGKTLFLGLGNPILSDDAIGICIVDELGKRLGTVKDVDFVTASVGGLHIMDVIRGYKRVVIVDSTQRGGKPGHLYCLGLDDLDGTVRLGSPHRINLPAAIEMMGKVADDIPDEITIYAVEVVNLTEFSERLSPALEDRLPSIVNEIIEKEFGGKL